MYACRCINLSLSFGTLWHFQFTNALVTIIDYWFGRCYTCTCNHLTRSIFTDSKQRSPLKILESLPTGSPFQPVPDKISRRSVFTLRLTRNASNSCFHSPVSDNYKCLLSFKLLFDNQRTNTLLGRTLIILSKRLILNMRTKILYSVKIEDKFSGSDSWRTIYICLKIKCFELTACKNTGKETTVGSVFTKELVIEVKNT